MIFGLKEHARKSCENSIKKIRPVLLLLSLFLFFRLLIVLTQSPNVQFSESFRAICAYDFIGGQKFGLFDYVFGHDKGGCLSTVLLAAIMFKLFGMNGFALRLAPLLFSLGALIIGYNAARKYWGKRVAGIFGLMFVFAPQTYVRLSLTAWGNHVESILFTFIMLYCLYQILNNEELSRRQKSLYVSLLGFVCGFSIWFAYINLVGVVTCFICAGIFYRTFFKRLRDLLYFACSIAVGLIPLFIYDFTYARSGAGLIYSKPIYAHFFVNGLKDAFIKLYAFFIYDLPSSLFFKNGFFLPRKILAYSYYLSCVVILTFYIVLKIKLQNSRHAFGGYEKSMGGNIFIFIYLSLFLAVYAVGDFRVASDIACNGYRYIAAIIPVFFLVFAQICSFLWDISGIAYRFVYIIAVLSLFGMISLMNPADFGKSFKRLPITYQSFGTSIAYKFGDEPGKCLNYARRIEPEYKGSFFWGLGDEIIEEYIRDKNKVNTLFEKIPEHYRVFFYIAIGGNIAQKYGWENIEKSIDLIKNINEKYRGYAYLGLGGAVELYKPSHVMEFSEYIEKEHLPYYFRGVGVAALFSADFNVRRCSDSLRKYVQVNEEIGKEYVACVFSGMGWALLNVDLEQKERKIINQELMSAVAVIDEKYRPFLLEGLKEVRLILQNLD